MVSVATLLLKLIRLLRRIPALTTTSAGWPTGSPPAAALAAYRPVSRRPSMPETSRRLRAGWDMLTRPLTQAGHSSGVETQAPAELARDDTTLEENRD